MTRRYPETTVLKGERPVCPNPGVGSGVIGTTISMEGPDPVSQSFSVVVKLLPIPESLDVFPPRTPPPFYSHLLFSIRLSLSLPLDRTFGPGTPR